MNNRAPPLVPFSFFNYDPVKEGTGQLARDGIFLSLPDNLYENRRGNRIDEYSCFVELFMELSSDESFFLRGKVRRGDLKILNLESCNLYVYIYSRDRQRSYLNRGKEARRLLIVFGSRPSPLEYEIAIEIAGSRVD